ncbi:response regulator transcription factor [Bacillus xiapuensis]|uniref:response regulator transcription factor n=1 Tax=Bacillus xiapuensis TaxID=2014075 RepID=UPI001E544073|nr:response regulator transcription factor [Bacillus xiapuensis]
MEKQENILLVEDDYEIARVVSDHLRKEGYQVTWASTGKEGLEDFRHGDYSLVIADLMLPELDGYSLCEAIRHGSDVPLLIISARQSDSSKIKGLGLGADDYITKPFSLGELSARICSHLKRYRRYSQQPFRQTRVEYHNGLAVDFTAQALYLHGEPLTLTAIEKDLFFLFAKHPFQTFTKSDLYKWIWGQDHLNAGNTVTVHIKSLRTKLSDSSRSPKFIQTVWGEGYRFIGEPLS